MSSTQQYSSTAFTIADGVYLLSYALSLQERLPENVPSQRSSLFGRSGSSSSAYANRDEATTKHALEEDNDRLVADLENKVSALKMATQGIHDEVNEHNRMLSGMVRPSACLPLRPSRSALPPIPRRLCPCLTQLHLPFLPVLCSQKTSVARAT